MFLFIGIGLLLDQALKAVFNIQTKDGEPTALLFIFIILWWVYAVYCAIRRLRDLNMSTWWLLSAFVPFVNIFVAIQLIFVRGDEGSNKSGEPLKRTYIMGLGV
jgi:uncharacterized membrane protein YhaH (DUF805 family)